MKSREPDGFAKAKTIFKELAPDRVNRLDGGRIAGEAIAAIKDALVGAYGERKAIEIAVNLTDWNSDAAFIVALHLSPLRYTKEKLDDSILQFILHAPEHVAEAARQLGNPVENIFKDDEGGSPI